MSKEKKGRYSMDFGDYETLVPKLVRRYSKA